ncbi:hypothetical protein HER32_06270 [Hymenobacter sp. BT18]|uniref:hypothetical protein n=1 Tax=Hymenobacter sp. BT18 TaxID=2835648 RepID=UPI00143EBA5D|nr:hypothetical protein [Hymenobacter sp. BT18]QIX60802.1 hypothetical protein HER32_06270 [Hymenobacter sp. BT18]
MFLQFALTLVGLLVCAGDIVALATLLTWQERAADPGSRRQRLLTGVVPLSSVLLLLYTGPDVFPVGALVAGRGQ